MDESCLIKELQEDTEDEENYYFQIFRKPP